MSDNRLLGADPTSLVLAGFTVDLDIGGPPPPKGSGMRYYAGQSDWIPYGQIDVALEDGRCVLIPDTEKRTIKLRIDMSALPEPLRSRSGTNTSKGELLHGDESELPMREAMYLFNTGRAMPVGNSPLDRFYAALSERKRRGPRSAGSAAR